MRALVLELVEGETLADRIRRGPLPVAEALTIARQIADALEAAHEKGHHPPRPEAGQHQDHARRRREGPGLRSREGGGRRRIDVRDLSQSPTVTAGGTREAIILGTAAYMSPEQARGKPVDKRADIWAFGCVLYEMLTGRRAFPGETIVRRRGGDPRDGSPTGTRCPRRRPRRSGGCCARCLGEGRQAQRLRDIGDARLEVDEARRELLAPGPAAAAASAAPNDSSGSPPSAFCRSWRRWPSRWAFRRRRRLPRCDLEINTPSVSDPDDLASLAISPDGQTTGLRCLRGRPGSVVECVSSTRSRRVPIPGTGEARMPFWSPDSHSVAFYADGDAQAHRPRRRVGADLDGGHRGSRRRWNREGVILSCPESGQSNHAHLRGGRHGGCGDAVRTRPRRSRFPHFLPDGRHFLYLRERQPPRFAASTWVSSMGRRHGNCSTRIRPPCMPSGHLALRPRRARSLRRASMCRRSK